MLLITGSTGNSGRHLMRELEAAGYSGRIRCIVRENTNTDFLEQLSLNLNLWRGDLSDQEFLNRACSGVETIMHIASIKFSRAVIGAALANDVGRAILVHTTGIYSRHKEAATEYRKIESSLQMLIDSAARPPSVVILRPTMIFGQPRDRNVSRFIELVDRMRIVPVIDHGESLIQPVHASDLGRAYMQVIQQKNLPEKEYVLSGERPVTMRLMLSGIGEMLGKHYRFQNVPYGFAELGARVARLLTIGKLDIVERVQRMGESRSFPHDTATRDFAYTPSPFFESLEREVQIYKSNKGVGK